MNTLDEWVFVEVYVIVFWKYEICKRYALP